MNKREAAIVSAYTGVMLGDFSELQKYAEEKFGRPIWTHKFANPNLAMDLKDFAHMDFMSLEVA